MHTVYGIEVLFLLANNKIDFYIRSQCQYLLLEAPHEILVAAHHERSRNSSQLYNQLIVTHASNYRMNGPMYPHTHVFAPVMNYKFKNDISMKVLNSKSTQNNYAIKKLNVKTNICLNNKSFSDIKAMATIYSLWL